MNHLQQVGIVKSIYRYPVKSMAGEQLVSAEVGWHGIDGDRRFAFARPGNLSGVPWLTASRMPELIRYHPYHTDAGNGLSPSVRVRTPEGADVEVESESLRQQIIATHGADVTLMRVNSGIFDDFPISFISTTTIANLETESGRTLDVRRFRPNFLIERTESTPVMEDAWIGKTLVLGNRAESPSVRITVRDVRCVMVNFDPETAVADPLVFKIIVHSRMNCAGVYASVMRVGTVTTGEGVYLAKE